MTNYESDAIIQELGELLDVAEDTNVELKEENDALKDILIDALLQLGIYKDIHIAELEDIINDLEEPFDDDDDCDCPMCH